MGKRWAVILPARTFFLLLATLLLVVSCSGDRKQAKVYVIGYVDPEGYSGHEAGQIPHAQKVVLQDPALLERRLIELINEARVAEGLLPLKHNEVLAAAARAHSWDMSSYNYFSHVSFDGFELSERLQRAGYIGAEYVAENIAAGFVSAESVFEAWMRSSAHRRNILHPNLREIGIGYFYEQKDAFGPYYHYWTAHFGARQGVYPVVINKDAPSTTSRVVTLYLHSSQRTKEMAIANDAPVQGTEWQPYQPVKEWFLSPRVGEAAVYVSLREDDGCTSVVSDSISLEGRRFSFRQSEAGYSGAADAYITSWNPDANYARANALPVRSDGAKAALIRFDLTSVPARSIVGQAILRLYILRGSPYPMSIKAYQLLRPWDVATVTWGRARPGVLWALPGASHVGTDRARDAVAKETVDRSDAWISLDITSLAQEWVANPASNQGLLLVGAREEVSISRQDAEYVFASSEYWRPHMRPVLELSLLPDDPPMPTSTPPVKPTEAPKPSATPSPTASTTPTPSATSSPTPVTISFQYGADHYYAASDTYLSAWAPDASFASSGTLNVRSDNAKVALLHFDIGKVPKGANVLRATLSLYIVSGGPHPMDVSVYGVIQPWDARQATWRWPLTGGSWGIPGCGGPGSDHIPFPTDIAHLASVNQWVDWDVTSLVAAWVMDPELNDGFVLKGSGSVSVQYAFASAEHWKLQERPRLTITYASP